MTGVRGKSGGRNRRPDALKQLNGSADKHPERRNSDAPAVAVQLAVAPEWLSDRAKTIYADVGAQALALRVIGLSDANALALCASALDDFLTADELVRAEGVVLSRASKDGFVKYRHPADAIREHSWRRFRDALRSFGLDPQSRATVKVIGDISESRFARYREVADGFH